MPLDIRRRIFVYGNPTSHVSISRPHWISNLRSDEDPANPVFDDGPFPYGRRGVRRTVVQTMGTESFNVSSNSILPCHISKVMTSAGRQRRHYSSPLRFSIYPQSLCLCLNNIKKAWQWQCPSSRRYSGWCEDGIQI